MDILKDLFLDNITEDGAYCKIDKVMDDIEHGSYDNLIDGEGRIDLASLLGMDEYEYTAYCQAAPLSVIAEWRYNGWPTRCCLTDRPLDYKEYHWFVTEYEHDKYGLSI
ncbi:hypothetical protein [Prevotella dentasini]|uniref:hypothetical protein n=1 Tax=Prevotella dentasini TaxID=589537 RepID=UPI00046839CA|nr:hypothetical protein [Prevotella dentasini]